MSGFVFSATPGQGDGFSTAEPLDGGDGNVKMNEVKKIEYEDGNPQKAMVHIADSVFDGLYAPWQDGLVASLLGKSMIWLNSRNQMIIQR